MDRCRLCLRESNLIDIFSINVHQCQALQEFIFRFTGIEIKPTDMISKLVCGFCCSLVTRAQLFRTKAVKNSKLLEKEYNSCMKQPESIIKSDVEKPSNESTEVNTAPNNSELVISDAVVLLNQREVLEYFADKNEYKKQVLACMQKIDQLQLSLENYYKIPNDFMLPVKQKRNNVESRKRSYLLEEQQDNVAPKTSKSSEAVDIKVETPSTSTSMNINVEKPTTSSSTNINIEVPSTSTSFTEIPPQTSLLEVTKKAVDVFECSWCQKIFERKRLLLVHQRVHLKCNNCKKRFTNFVKWEKHLKNVCKLPKNLPALKLEKVDNNRQMTEKNADLANIESEQSHYPNAEKETNCDKDKDSGNSSCTNSNPETSSLIMVDVKKEVEDDFMFESDTTVTYQEDFIATPKINYNEDIVCISDSEIDFIPVSTKIEVVEESDNNIEPVCDNNVLHELPEIYYIYDDKLIDVDGSSDTQAIIKQLFKKYIRLTTSNNESQTADLTENLTTSTFNNLYVYHNMTEHLNDYVIPVITQKSDKKTLTTAVINNPIKKIERPMLYSRPLFKPQDIRKDPKQLMLKFKIPLYNKEVTAQNGYFHQYQPNTNNNVSIAAAHLNHH